jgi:hypothetical protein
MGEHMEMTRDNSAVKLMNEMEMFEIFEVFGLWLTEHKGDVLLIS